MYHGLAYACHIFNVLPVKGLFVGNHVSTPYELFHGIKRSINHVSVCLGALSLLVNGLQEITALANRPNAAYGVSLLDWITTRRATSSTPRRPANSTFLQTLPLMNNFIAGLLIHGSFSKTLWHYTPLMVIYLCPPPHLNTYWGGHGLHCRRGMEDTANMPATHPPADVVDDNDDNVPELVDDDDDSTAKYDSDSEIDHEEVLDLETPPEPEPASISPQPITEQAGVRRCTRARKPNPKYANAVQGYEWENNNTTVSPMYQQLARACAIEATPTLPMVGDTLSWEPAPNSIRDILKMPDGTVHQEWLKSVKKELKTLVDSKTFEVDNLQDGETSTPVMEIFKVKVKSDGSLDKLKTWLVVRGDLQDKRITEDKWSPTASFRSLKMFLAHASRLKVRVKQLDVVGAFLQAKMHSRMFVTIPKIFGILFPEYQWCTGKPVRLQMSMYRTTLCGKYWYLDLLDYLKGSGFKEGDSVKCLFIKQFADGAEIFLLNYVDDMTYYGTDAEKVREFEEQLGNRFNMELMGQPHWYLGSRIRQFANFDIELDQSRYCKSIVKRYLDSAGCAKNLRQHDMPLPSEFTPTNDNCSSSEAEAENLATQYNIDFVSCVGSVIYLGMTRTDILFAVNKLAKYTRKPGKAHLKRSSTY